MEPEKVYKIVPSGSGFVVLDTQSNTQLFPSQVFPSEYVALHALGELANTKRWRMVVSQKPDTRIEIHPILMNMQLSITQELDATLNSMAEDLRDSKGHTILRAIALLKTAMEAKAEGKRIAIVDDSDNSEQEIEY